MVKTLRAPKGTDEVNYEGTAYRVDNSGLVTVPDAAAEALLKTGGLVEVTDDQEPVGRTVEEGTVRMVSIGEPVAGVSWGGQSFQADPDGSVHVPVAAVAELVAHGLIVEADRRAQEAAAERAAQESAERQRLQEETDRAEADRLKAEENAQREAAAKAEADAAAAKKKAEDDAAAEAAKSAKK